MPRPFPIVLISDSLNLGSAYLAAQKAGYSGEILTIDSFLEKYDAELEREELLRMAAENEARSLANYVLEAPSKMDLDYAFRMPKEGAKERANRGNVPFYDKFIKKDKKSNRRY